DRAAPKAPPAVDSVRTTRISRGVTPPRAEQIPRIGAPQSRRVRLWAVAAFHFPKATRQGDRGVQTRSPRVPRRTSRVTRSDAAEIAVRMTRAAWRGRKAWTTSFPMRARA